ncbi:hypothetical protein [Butyrivibrio sp. FCS014]|uniref:hypothetical protein n=1 Tax=Butyrivibrio sp. FCS014 TaxID=1408304 RepID=UPI0012DF037C|nr:hypothetical protein [Butyrivibrio sp. FCS014]
MDKEETTDGKSISVETFLGTWDPFADNGDDMKIVIPTEKVNVDPEEPEGGAAETTYVFDATTLTAAKDKEVIEVGTTFANGYITAYGGVTKRINSSTQKVTSTEIGKSERQLL